jgi:hypothetical protein
MNLRSIGANEVIGEIIHGDCVEYDQAIIGHRLFEGYKPIAVIVD